MPSWPWTPWRWRSGCVGIRSWRAWSTTPIAACSTWPSSSAGGGNRVRPGLPDLASRHAPPSRRLRGELTSVARIPGVGAAPSPLRHAAQRQPAPEDLPASTTIVLRKTSSAAQVQAAESPQNLGRFTVDRRKAWSSEFAPASRLAVRKSSRIAPGTNSDFRTAGTFSPRQPAACRGGPPVRGGRRQAARTRAGS